MPKFSICYSSNRHRRSDRFHQRRFEKEPIVPRRG